MFIRDVRLQVSNVLVRDQMHSGVQISPKLSIMIIYAEHSNTVPSPRFLGAGITARRAVGVTDERDRKKQMSLYSGENRA